MSENTFNTYRKAWLGFVEFAFKDGTIQRYCDAHDKTNGYALKSIIQNMAPELVEFTKGIKPKDGMESKRMELDNNQVALLFDSLRTDTSDYGLSTLCLCYLLYRYKLKVNKVISLAQKDISFSSGDYLIWAGARQIRMSSAFFAILNKHAVRSIGRQPVMSEGLLWTVPVRKGQDRTGLTYHVAWQRVAKAGKRIGLSISPETLTRCGRGDTSWYEI